METVNAELVGQITALVQAWTTADRRLKDMFSGWDYRATRAGLEKGFYLQLAKLPGADKLYSDDIDDLEDAGRTVYAAYRIGGVLASMDQIKA